MDSRTAIIDEYDGLVVRSATTGSERILELARKILAMTQSPAQLVYQPLPPDDPVKRRPDITWARELLDWQPQVPLTSGLEETIPYFVRKLKQENYKVVAGPTG